MKRAAEAEGWEGSERERREQERIVLKQVAKRYPFLELLDQSLAFQIVELALCGKGL